MTMKKKHLKEACAGEAEEQKQGYTKHVSIETFQRYALQLSEEEQDTMTFREIMADMIGVESDDIKSVRRVGMGWDVKVGGAPFKGIEDIMDDNKDTLDRLKDSDDDTYDIDNLDDDFMPEDDDDMKDWEREGYSNEIAYKNRWRDYQD